MESKSEKFYNNVKKFQTFIQLQSFIYDNLLIKLS